MQKHIKQRYLSNFQYYLKNNQKKHNRDRKFVGTLIYLNRYRMTSY